MGCKRTITPSVSASVCLLVSFVDKRVRYSDKHLLQLPCHIPPGLPRTHVRQQWWWRNGKRPAFLSCTVTLLLVVIFHVNSCHLGYYCYLPSTLPTWNGLTIDSLGFSIASYIPTWSENFLISSYFLLTRVRVYPNTCDCVKCPCSVFNVERCYNHLHC